MTIAPDPAEITPPHSSSAYARRRGLGGWTVLGLCAASLVAGAALAAYAPRWRHVEEPQAPTPAPLVTPTVQTPAPPAQTPLASEPTGDVSGLQSRVQALESGQDRTVQAAAAALAAALLSDAARTSRPFTRELTAVEQVLPTSPDTAPLRRLAQTGAPTRAALSAEFDDAAAKAAVAARDPGEQGAFLDRLSFALASVVTIRRVGSTIGDQPDAVLARAERQVDEGDIDGALTTLNALPVGARRAMAAWRLGAERRAEIDRHVVAIRATALAGLAQVSGTPA
jgi:hypothetical protein